MALDPVFIFLLTLDAYSAPYGGGEGLTFKEVATEKEQTLKRKAVPKSSSV